MSGDRYQISDQSGIYYCTFTIIHWIDLLTRPSYKNIIVDSLNYCIENKGLELYSWVIMSNHMHIVAKTNGNLKFSNFLRDFKKFVSKAMIQEILRTNESRKEWLLDKFSFEARRTKRAENYKIWQDSNHAILIDNDTDIWQKINYIHNNPVKAEIVDNPSHYIFSSSRDYEGEVVGTNLLLKMSTQYF